MLLLSCTNKYKNYHAMINTISSVPQKERKEWRDLLTGELNVPLKNFFLQMKVTQAKNQVATGKISLEEAVEDIHNLCVKFFKAKNMDTDLATIFSATEEPKTAINGNAETSENNFYDTSVPEKTSNNVSQENNTEKADSIAQQKQDIAERLKIKEEKQKLEAERQRLAEERRKLELEKIKLEAERKIQAQLLEEQLRKKREKEALLEQEAINTPVNDTPTNLTDESTINNEATTENTLSEEDISFNNLENNPAPARKRSFFGRMFGIFKK